jgi:putative membrane protein
LLALKATHYVALFLLLWASLQKNRLLTPSTITTENLARVMRFDKLSSATAGVMMLSGLVMLMWFAKPTAYYLVNLWFWLKMALFVLASALVVLSKIELRKALAHSQGSAWTVTRKVRGILRFDFVGLWVLVVLGLVIAHP